jgi:2-C-methyl-D-erythritol 4-phosphate cytidylyltransferase
VAAGRGTRAGDGAPKQFRDLAGVPVLQRAWRSFAAARAVGEIVLVLPGEVAADPPAWLRQGPGRIVAGGATRSESVRRGLEALSGAAATVLVHDGVRPFVSSALIARVLEAAGSGPVVPLLPIQDTVKEIDREGTVLRTLERACLRRAQTPQGFPADLLREVHERAARTGRGATDDAALCEAAGHPVRGVPGEATNLKLTTPEDFAYAAWLLESGRVR